MKILERTDPFSYQDHIILLGPGGSKAYGTSTPESDTDYRGVLVPPREYYLSPFKNFEQTEWHSEDKTEEGVVYGLLKFIALASDCNPNMIEILFLKPEQYLIAKYDLVEELLTNRNLFLSNRAVYSFVGYAQSQLKRIKTHRKWILNPPHKLPERSDYGLPEQPLKTKHQLANTEQFILNYQHSFAPWLIHARNSEREAFWEGIQDICNLVTVPTSWYEIQEQALINTAVKLGFDTNFVEYLAMERKYQQAVTHFNQYLEWKEKRNETRAALETKYHYDTKHGMHLVRLLRMGKEILTQGTVQVFRPDAEELLSIRNGAWSYEQIVDFAETASQEIYNLIRDGKSVVANKPNINKIESVTLKILDRFYDTSCL